jgi:hypothetical protein
VFFFFFFSLPCVQGNIRVASVGNHMPQGCATGRRFPVTCDGMLRVKKCWTL